MKLIMLALMCSAMMACTPSSQNPVTPTTPTATPVASPTATPIGPQEPGEQPSKIVDGMKYGKQIEVNVVKIWEYNRWHGTAQLCSSIGASNGGSCANHDAGSVCSMSEDPKSWDKLNCNKKFTLKAYGWVYEKTSDGMKPMQGVKIELNFWNGVGIVDRKEVATTNQFGYYEFVTGDFKNQILGSKDGYLAACNQKDAGFPSNMIPLPQNTQPMVLVKSSEACK